MDTEQTGKKQKAGGRKAARLSVERYLSKRSRISAEPWRSL